VDAAFWHQRWHDNNIGFHQSEANALLVACIDRLSLEVGSRVFVPLCGKSRDMAWLRAQGYRVAGAELSATAVEQFFAEIGLEPHRHDLDALTRYSADGIDLFVGDFFDLTGDVLGPVDAVYDRAALIALPEAMRARYAAHLMAITETAPQFLIGLDYDQRQMDGPPFSVPDEELYRLYGDRYELTWLVSRNVAGGLKGIVEATEHAWLLHIGTEGSHGTATGPE
jgi:thiopurine S-methyltransferase